MADPKNAGTTGKKANQGAAGAMNKGVQKKASELDKEDGVTTPDPAKAKSDKEALEKSQANGRQDAIKNAAAEKVKNDEAEEVKKSKDAAKILADENDEAAEKEASEKAEADQAAFDKEVEEEAARIKKSKDDKAKKSGPGCKKPVGFKGNDEQSKARNLANMKATVKNIGLYADTVETCSGPMGKWLDAAPAILQELNIE